MHVGIVSKNVVADGGACGEALFYPALQRV
jgi:hypothetical protein